MAICAALTVIGTLTWSVISADSMVSAQTLQPLPDLAQSFLQRGPYSFTLRIVPSSGPTTTTRGVVSDASRVQLIPGDSSEEYIVDGQDLYHQLLPAGSWEVVHGAGPTISINPDKLIIAIESAVDVVPKVLGYDFRLPDSAATAAFGSSGAKGVLGAASVTEFGELGRVDYKIPQAGGQDIVAHLEVAGSGVTAPLTLPTGATTVTSLGHSVIQTCSLLDAGSLTHLLTTPVTVGLDTSQVGNQNICTVTGANRATLAAVSISSHPYSLSEFETDIRDAPSNPDGSRPVVNPVSVPGLGTRAEWEAQYSTLFVLAGSREVAIDVRASGDQLSMATIMAKALLARLAA